MKGTFRVMLEETVVIYFKVLLHVQSKGTEEYLKIKVRVGITGVEIRSEYIDDSGFRLFNDAVSIAAATYCNFIKLQDNRNI